VPVSNSKGCTKVESSKETQYFWLLAKILYFLEKRSENFSAGSLPIFAIQKQNKTDGLFSASKML